MKIEDEFTPEEQEVIKKLARKKSLRFWVAGLQGEMLKEFLEEYIAIDDIIKLDEKEWNLQLLKNELRGRKR